jgi:thioredoxin 1
MNKKILYFTAVWCGPCRMMSPIMNELMSTINIEKIDVDSKDERVVKYSIKAVPSFILVDENGIELKNRIVGGQSKTSIENFYNN